MCVLYWKVNLVLIIGIMINIGFILFLWCCFYGWKVLFVIWMCVYVNIVSGKILVVISYIKINYLILNFVCGKKVIGYCKWCLVNVILLVWVCLMVSIWWLVSKWGYLILFLGWYGVTLVMWVILLICFVG